ncbi:hypothetical protein DL769_003627 [Monosporascus sp. CRB-8-3]|nr:hypothetical protein DL769_003627 [Monosporascus sp. CRB-8-3]
MGEKLDIAAFPAEMRSTLDIFDDVKKDVEKLDDAHANTREEEYKKFERKIDKCLLPLIWLCYGIQQTDKTSIGTGTVERPTLVNLAAWCCISPGFILVIGSRYKTREHASRSLVFQSANAGFGVIASLILYGIRSVHNSRPDFQAWRYVSFFRGLLTILVGVGCLCLVLLGTPSEARWLSPEKRIANARFAHNNTGNDRAGIKERKWKHVGECLVDPCVILQDIPSCITPVMCFVLIGLATSRWKNLRMWLMMFSTVPAFVGFIIVAMLPNEPQNKWTKWVGYFMTVPCDTSPAPLAAPSASLEFLTLAAWRAVLALRNRRRDARLRTEGSQRTASRGVGSSGSRTTPTSRTTYFRYTTE